MKKESPKFLSRFAKTLGGNKQIVNPEASDSPHGPRFLEGLGNLIATYDAAVKEWRKHSA